MLTSMEKYSSAICGHGSLAFIFRQPKQQPSDRVIKDFNPESAKDMRQHKHKGSTAHLLTAADRLILQQFLARLRPAPEKSHLTVLSCTVSPLSLFSTA